MPNGNRGDSDTYHRGHFTHRHGITSHRLLVHFSGVSTYEPIRLQPNELDGAVHDRAGSRQHCLQPVDLPGKKQRVKNGTDMSINLTLYN